MNYLLQVLAALKLAEVNLNEAAETDDWLMQTVDVDPLLKFQREISDYIASQVKLEEFPVVERTKQEPTPEPVQEPELAKLKHKKLDEDKVKTIIGLLHSGCRQADIARRFGVDVSCISKIAQGKTWGNVPRPLGFPKAKQPKMRKRLTKSEAERIVEYIDMGTPYSTIAQLFDITTNCVSHIATGRTWSDIYRPNGITRKRRVNGATFAATLNL